MVTSPPATYSTITAVSRDNAWAAGGGGDTLVHAAHWDGRDWTLIEDAIRPGRFTYALGSSASGPKEVWIVGNAGVAPFAQRFNGRRFIQVPVPYKHWRANDENQDDSFLADVEAISARNVWAVGNFGVDHYNGRRWNLISRARSYRTLAAAGPTEVWAVGGGKVIRFDCKH
jgi:hypothetical protein